MLRLLLRLFGRRVAHEAVQRHTQNGGPLDVRFGLALLRDRRVSRFVKMRAIALGVTALMVLNVLDFPLEAFVAVALPLIGLPLDIVWNGVELLAVPLMVASLLMPLLTPSPLVAQLRAERAGVGPVIDVAHREPPRRRNLKTAR